MARSATFPPWLWAMTMGAALLDLRSSFNTRANFCAVSSRAKIELAPLQQNGRISQSTEALWSSSSSFFRNGDSLSNHSGFGFDNPRGGIMLSHLGKKPRGQVPCTSVIIADDTRSGHESNDCPSEFRRLKKWLFRLWALFANWAMS